MTTVVILPAATECALQLIQRILRQAADHAALPPLTQVVTLPIRPTILAQLVAARPAIRDSSIGWIGCVISV